MAAFFEELFSGTGVLNGKTPDTPVSGRTWNGTPDFTLTGGFAVSDVAGSTCSYDASDAAFPNEYVLELTYRTSSDVSTPLVAVTRMRLDVTDSPFFTDYLSATLNQTETGEWWLVLDDGVNTASADVTVSVAANTTYTISLFVAGGAHKLIAFGKTLRSNKDTSAIDLDELFIAAAGEDAFGAISLTAKDIGAFDQVCDTYSVLEISAFSPEFIDDYAISSLTLSSLTTSVFTPPVVTSGLSLSSLTDETTVLINDAVSELVLSSVAIGYTDTDAVSSLTLGETTTSFISTTATDNLALTSGADSVREARTDATSSLILNSRVSDVNSADVLVSTIAFSSQTSSKSVVVTDVQSGLSLSSATSEARTSTTDVTSSLSLSNLVTEHLSALTTAKSSIAFDDRAFYDLLYEAWVMNAQTHAMSRYNGLLYKSVAMIGDRMIALGDTGFFELDAATDDATPVVAKAVTGLRMLGTERLKRLGDISIGYKADGPVSFGITQYGAKEGTYLYNLPTWNAEAPRGGRVVPGKGLLSKYYQFTITGQRLNLDYATVEVGESTTRRI
jgi:hypothetical protein